MKKLNEVYVKSMNKMNGLLKNERGSQTLEWIGIAAVVVIAVGLISTAFSGGNFGESVLKKFTTWIEKIG
ncbi:Uncharacterised protein [Bacillus freudenreichii]|nr:Uncharacterised protein [Bacillus freudenreichii]